MIKVNNKHDSSTSILWSIRQLFKDSRMVGILLLFCTIISLFWSNSSGSDAYLSFWNEELGNTLGMLHLPHSILHWVNDGLMAVFFFLVGLEIKRELLKGDLSSIKKSLLPIAGAIGGMAVPALFYMVWCGNSIYSHGWGIPMATDIAFSLGILSILGNRVPASLRILLTALAIIDDLGGILTIAIFYTNDIRLNYLLYAGVVTTFLILLNIFNVRKLILYFVSGIILWYFVFNSGVHATIAGVLLAFCLPLDKGEKVEHRLHNPVNFFILPIFALANTAIVLPEKMSFVFQSNLHHGITMGLVLGKPIGIFGCCYLVVKSRLAQKSANISWMQILGMSILAGVGFTISIFISMLAFDDITGQTIAKVSVMMASLVAAVLGLLFLLWQTAIPQSNKSIVRKRTYER
ncbi:MAG: Na+/H+ antiporter NhaA [Bacteroidetes bacterium]|nr:Na+/H+ antiporter NhaA [Bacteroidota bacterium]